MAAGGIGPNNGDPTKNYPGEITFYVLITCIVAAMGGLIFGYDIGISGKHACIQEPQNIYNSIRGFKPPHLPSKKKNLLSRTFHACMLMCLI